ncbi:MAG: flagellar basal-body rod protein FlgF [Candidatus Caldatribacteriaceae bacterium]
MIRGIYTGASALNVYELKQEVLANNLANLDTPGYKKDVFSIESSKNTSLYRFGNEENPMLLGEVSFSVQPGTTSYIDFSPGRIEATGNALDLAIEGEGFFVINVDGEEAYTRAGNFTLDRNGRLVTVSGYPVQGKSGEIIIPPISEIHFDDRGRILLNGEVIDELQVVDFDDRSVLQKREGNLFVRRDTAIQGVEARNFRIRQGFLEKSNVDIIEAMVDMISALREYEMSQKAILSHDETLNRAANDIARLG